MSRDDAARPDPSVVKNRDYFATHHATYAALVQRLGTYRRVRAAVTECLGDCGSLLDVGNGGVFAYDVSRPSSITAVDLFPVAAGHWPAHVAFRIGDALDLPVADHSFDTVFASMLIHHLTGRTAAESRDNMVRFFQECRRVVKPNGRLVFSEPCVPRWFFDLECRVFEGLQPKMARWVKHPLTLQYTADEISRRMAHVCDADVTIHHVPKSAVVLQFGVPFPAFLTPIQGCIFECRTR